MSFLILLHDEETVPKFRHGAEQPSQTQWQGRHDHGHEDNFTASHAHRKFVEWLKDVADGIPLPAVVGDLTPIVVLAARSVSWRRFCLTVSFPSSHESTPRVGAPAAPSTGEGIVQPW